MTLVVESAAMGATSKVEPLREIAIVPFYDLSLFGRTLWCADTTREVLCAFDIESGKEVVAIATQNGFLGLRVGTGLLAAGNDRRTLYDWTGKELRLLSFPEDNYPRVEDVDRGGRFVVGHSSETLVVWDPKTGNVVHQAALGYWPQCAIAPDGRQIAVTRAKRDIELVDTATWQRHLVKGTALTTGHHTSWSPDGKTLVLYAGHKAHVVDCVKRVLVKTVKTSHIWDAVFVRGRWLTSDGTLYDTKTWDVIGKLKLGASMIAVSDDGERIVTAERKGPIRVWATDALLGASAPPKPKSKTASKPRGKPILGVFFGVPKTVTREQLIAAAEGLHWILDNRPNDFAMELYESDGARDRHWFRFLASRGRAYALEPWIECLYADLEVPIDVVLRNLTRMRAHRFDPGGSAVTIDHEDYLGPARMGTVIHVMKNRGKHGEEVPRAEVQHLVNRVEQHYPPCFSGVKSIDVPKAMAVPAETPTSKATPAVPPSARTVAPSKPASSKRAGSARTTARSKPKPKAAKKRKAK